jgi:hypothetical protein
VANLWGFDPKTTPLTAETAGQWRQNLDYLVQGGAASIPALAEFLRANQDRVFSATEAGMLGYGSMRNAIFDALGRIGGPAAIDLMGEVLETTASPREIAVLAKNLETLAPEQYRGAAVEAARQALAMAGEKEMQGYDVAPLFEVFQKYGGPEGAADLEKAASHWNYYATLALGNLPDGAGVPSLIRLIETGPNNQQSIGRLQALQVLSELASSNEAARAALIEHARANRISATEWAYLVRPLSGEKAHVQDSVLNENQAFVDQFKSSSAHVRFNNQNFFYAPPDGVFNLSQLNQQLRLVDELLGVSSNPDATRTLQKTRSDLEIQISKLAAGATP